MVPDDQLPTHRASKWPIEVQDAHHWVKTFCHHSAVIGKDFQSISGLTERECATAIQHLLVLRNAGLLIEGPALWKNFIVQPL